MLYELRGCRLNIDLGAEVRNAMQCRHIRCELSRQSLKQVWFLEQVEREAKVLTNSIDEYFHLDDMRACQRLLLAGSSYTP